MNITVAPHITIHQHITLARVNSKINAEIEAIKTLRNGLKLQDVEIDEEHLGIIDSWLNYAEDALEGVSRQGGRQICWAEYAMVKTVDRYLEPEEGPYGESHPADRGIEWQGSYERSAKHYMPPSKIPPVIEEMEDKIFLPSLPANNLINNTIPSGIAEDPTIRRNRFKRESKYIFIQTSFYFFSFSFLYFIYFLIFFLIIPTNPIANDK